MKLRKSGSSQVPKDSMRHRAGLSFKRISKGKMISCFDLLKEHGIDKEELFRVKSCKARRRFVVDEEELSEVKSCKKSPCKKSPCKKSSGRVLKELKVLGPVEYGPFQEDLPYVDFPPELVELKGFCGECYMDGEDWNECPHKYEYCFFCDKKCDHWAFMCPEMEKDPDAFEKLLRRC